MNFFLEKFISKTDTVLPATLWQMLTSKDLSIEMKFNRICLEKFFRYDFFKIWNQFIFVSFNIKALKFVKAIKLDIFKQTLFN